MFFRRCKLELRKDFQYFGSLLNLFHCVKEFEYFKILPDNELCFGLFCGNDTT
jgi:hypothetical protein